MTPSGWEEEVEDESPWMEEVEDEFEDEEEFQDESEEFLAEDDEFADDEDTEDEDEDELEPLIDEAEALIEEGEYEQALDLFREAAERFPESAEAAYKLGDTALMIFANGAEISVSWEDDDDLAAVYEEAINGFEMALSIDDTDYQAYNGLGTLYMVAGNPEAAVENWEKSLDINADQEEIAAALEEARGLL
ncbi:MAG: Anaphase-promoting complex, cyclosome, subunit 3 [Candidatus Sumerlaeota bacterium]|nr:Anaphase-promoting complex, cyclosome, subunit 3 [Candidatus Sumerlaeota bacterium]